MSVLFSNFTPKEKQTICAIIFPVIARAAHFRPKQSSFEWIMLLDEILPVYLRIAHLHLHAGASVASRAMTYAYAS